MYYGKSIRRFEPYESRKQISRLKIYEDKEGWSIGMKWNVIHPYLWHKTLQWRHNKPDGVSNHQPHNSLPNRLFGHRSKKASKLRVIGLGEGNSPETGEFLAQKASNAEIVSIWWRHHDKK